MHHASDAPDALQHLKGLVEGLAAVYHQRQTQLGSLRGLHLERQHLLVAPGFVPVQVHAHLAHGFVVGAQGGEGGLYVVAPGGAHLGRVQTHGREHAPRACLLQGAQRRYGGEVHVGHQHGLHSGLDGAVDGCGAASVAVELGQVEMRVGVEYAHGRGQILREAMRSTVATKNSRSSGRARRALSRAAMARAWCSAAAASQRSPTFRLS